MGLKVWTSDFKNYTAPPSAGLQGCKAIEPQHMLVPVFSGKNLKNGCFFGTQPILACGFSFCLEPLKTVLQHKQPGLAKLEDRVAAVYAHEYSGLQLNDPDDPTQQKSGFTTSGWDKWLSFACWFVACFSCVLGICVC